MTETVAIRLNKRRLIENLRFAFPNRYSVVTELLQNARRAGATCVDLTYEREREAPRGPGRRLRHRGLPGPPHPR